MTPEIPMDLRVDTIRWYANNPVKDEQDLWRLACALAGHPWIRKSICKGHVSPWDMIRDVYFRKAGEFLAIGPRAGYKTRSAGLLFALEMISRPGIEFGHGAASVDQTQRASSWTKMYLDSKATRLAGVSNGEGFYKKRIQIPNGSSLTVLPATMVGVNAFHGQCLVLDEFELIKPEVIDEARMSPQSHGGYGRCLLFLSSRKFRNGNVDKLNFDRRYKHVLKLTWCIAEIVEKCPESRRGTVETFYEDVEDRSRPESPMMVVKAWDKCGKCVILGECRSMFASSEGWAQIDDLIQEFMSLDRMTWASQKRSLRVSPERGRVFTRFSEERNVRELKLDPSVPLQIVVDFGGGTAPTAVLFYQLVGSEFHILDEYVCADSVPSFDVEAVESILKVEFPDARMDRCPADSASPILISEWNRHTEMFQLIPVKKQPLTKRDMVMTLLGIVEPARGGSRWIIDPRCKIHIEEMRSFQYRERISGGRVRQGSYKDDNADTVDAATYIVIDSGVGLRGGDPLVMTIDTTGHREDSNSASKKKPAISFTYAEYIGDKMRRMRERMSI